MIEEKFSELVNLYLDKEISAEDLELLKAELADNSERKIEFQERCRLHQAMRLAMSGASSLSNSGGRGSSRSSRRRVMPAPSAKSIRTNKSTLVPQRAASTATRRLKQSSNRSSKVFDEPPSAVRLPRWATGLAFAACMVIGYMILSPFLKEVVHVSKHTLKSVYQDEVDASAYPLDAVDRLGLKRFANSHQSIARKSSSLAAELRLLGLHPEVMEQDVALSEISIASIQPRDVSKRRIEMLNQMKEYSPMPVPTILETAEPRGRRSTSWPAGFQTSLANFK